MRFAHSSTTILKALQTELEFLEQGGYYMSSSRRYPPLIFEEGPHHLQPFKREDWQRSPLIEFVPLKYRCARTPYRHIALTEDGQTLQTMYRTATQNEILTVVRAWLKRQIIDLQERMGEYDGVDAEGKDVSWETCGKEAAKRLTLVLK